MFSDFRVDGIRLAGFGHYLPQEVVSNQQLISETNLPLSDTWIQKRIGVISRHRVAPDENTSDLALYAAQMAIERAEIDPTQIDLIVLSTISPDHPNPSTACALQAKLGIAPHHCTAFDISAACSGFLYALDVGARYILTGARKVLVVSAEIRSRFINPQEPGTYPIFGDGAGAVILESGPAGQGLLALFTGADGRGYYSVHIPAGGSAQPASTETIAQGGHFITMPQGEKVFFEVVEGMTHFTQQFLSRAQVKLADIDFVIVHQANLNILREVQRRLEIPAEKMLINIQTTGNTSSASIPIVISQNLENGTLQPGQRLLLIAVGAGHTLGVSLIQL